MHLVSSKLLAIAASLIIFAQAYYIRQIVGTYIFPASLMSLAWFLYTFIPLTFLYNVPINPIPIFYIAICILAFSLSALPFNWKKAFETNKQKSSEDTKKLDGKLMHYLFFISVFYAIFFTTMVVLDAGFTLTSMAQELRWVSTRFAIMRASGQINYDIYGILSVFLTYLSPILGGLVSHGIPNRIKKLAFIAISFFPPLYFMVLQSAKLAIFYSAGLFIASLLLRKIQSNNFKLFNIKIILTAIASILVLAPFLLFSFATRNDHTRLADIVNASLHSVQSYAFAQIYAFSDYFSFYLSPESSVLKYQHDLNSYGSYTFTSIYNLFGHPKSFPMGTYYDYYYYKDLLSTNIFTIFRALINDFGPIGTIIFMFGSGLIIHFFYYRMLIKNSRIANAVFIITVVYIEGTYLASIFMARYMYLLLAALFFIFWLNDKYEEKSLS